MFSLEFGEFRLQVFVERDGKRSLVISHETPELLQPVHVTCGIASKESEASSKSLSHPIQRRITILEILANKLLEVLEKVVTELLFQTVAVEPEETLQAIPTGSTGRT
jgi:hypothetical protein